MHTVALNKVEHFAPNVGSLGDKRVPFCQFLLYLGVGIKRGEMKGFPPGLKPAGDAKIRSILSETDRCRSSEKFREIAEIGMLLKFLEAF